MRTKTSTNSFFISMNLKFTCKEWESHVKQWKLYLYGIIIRKKSCLTDYCKFNGKFLSWCPEWKLWSRTSTPIEIGGAGLQWSNLDMVDLARAVKEVLVWCVFTSCQCVICSWCISIFNDWLCVFGLGNPWNSYVISPHQWNVHLQQVRDPMKNKHGHVS